MISIDALVVAIESLRGTPVRRHDEKTVKDALLPILSAYRPVSTSPHQSSIWWRARKCEGNKRYQNLHDLIYPPADKVTFGRANLPNKPAMYASWNTATAVAEVAAQPGDLIQVIGIRRQRLKPFSSLLVGEIQSVYNSGGSIVNSRDIEKNLAQLIRSQSDESNLIQLYCDSFFSDLFRRETRRPQEYLPTAVYADIVYGSGMGLSYASVENAHAMNIAMSANTFSTTFEVLFTMTLRVENYFGFGVYKLSPSPLHFNFAKDGSIMWDSVPSVHFVHSLSSGIRVDPAYDGWQLPL